jgi:hypothetical protein
MTSRSPGDVQLNAEVSWDDTFDPIAYVDHNYRDLHAEDAEILNIVRDHFSDHFREHGGGSFSGIDVGPGPNLYPALAMLPWCDRITLFERSRRNVRHLEGQVGGYADNWDQFWRVLCKSEAYAALDMDPRAKFREAVEVRQGNIFDLLEHEGRWHVGTMFFVAESMTTSIAEFNRGVECFMRALAPGAPFAAAFMEHSRGYPAGSHHFPACDVGEAEVSDSLGPFSAKFETIRLGAPAAVREGYSGMIVACGHRNSDSFAPVVHR